MSKIIHVRGTSGSGKSHLARRVMALYPSHQDVRIMDRKRPFATQHFGPGLNLLHVPGHYETDCGGADTIATYDDYFNDVAAQYQHGNNVLFEGLLATPEYNRTIKLHELAGKDLHVVFLTTPLEECVASVNARRQAKAALKGRTADPLNPKNTISKQKGAESTRKKLFAAGVQTYQLDREEAFLLCCKLLGF